MRFASYFSLHIGLELRSPQPSSFSMSVWGNASRTPPAAPASSPQLRLSDGVTRWVLTRHEATEESRSGEFLNRCSGQSVGGSVGRWNVCVCVLHVFVISFVLVWFNLSRGGMVL